MRTKDSICYLCDLKKANKTNSHIFPKFITKSILGNNKGYQIDVHNADKHPKIIQDTPKENYILCENCEKYFEILETYVATRMHNRIKDIRYSSEFNFIDAIPNKNYKLCTQINPAIMRLFIYSIIFRTHISSLLMFKDFELQNNDFQELKKTLTTYYSNSQTEVLNNVENFTSQQFNLTFAFITAENTGDDTENFIFVHPIAKDPYLFVLNKYLLAFSVNNNTEQSKYGIWNNIENDMIKIGFISATDWIKIKKSYIHVLSSASKEALLKQGKPPYLGKLN